MDFPANLGIALALTIIAGLSTGIGSAIAYFIKKPKLKYLSFSLGFSAGVMLYISFMEMLSGAVEEIGENASVFAFFLGVLFIGIIDQFIPEHENPHEFKNLDDQEDPAQVPPPSPSYKHIESIKDNEMTIQEKNVSRDSLSTEPEMKKMKKDIPEQNTTQNVNDDHLMRTGVFTALAIGIHNFPEGLATFGTALNNVELGIFIALAISIHNIPEGVSVSMPIYYATGDKKTAFKYSFLSGVAEPVGAIVGFMILLPFLSNGWLLPGLLAFVAGIMVYISLDELLPMAHNYGHNHLVISGTMLGMFIMALSLLML